MTWKPAAAFGLAFLAFEVGGYVTRKYWTVSQWYAHERKHHPTAMMALLIVVQDALTVHLGYGVANRIVEKKLANV